MSSTAKKEGVVLEKIADKMLCGLNFGSVCHLLLW
jgi:hypothetical protein